jgi:calcineurin-like phosphoesterase family protein
MDTNLIKNWNSTVSKQDTVYFLGDLAYGPGSMRYTLEYDKLLNGNIIFIRGNHYDSKDARRAPLALDYDYKGRKEIHFFLCHDPEKALMTREWSEFHSRLVKEKEEHEENRDSYWVLHGHHHNNYPRTFPFINGEMRRCNVSVELIEYTPLDLDRLCNLIFDRKVIWMQSLDSKPVYATSIAQ